MIKHDKVSCLDPTRLINLDLSIKIIQDRAGDLDTWSIWIFFYQLAGLFQKLGSSHLHQKDQNMGKMRLWIPASFPSSLCKAIWGHIRRINILDNRGVYHLVLNQRFRTTKQDIRINHGGSSGIPCGGPGTVGDYLKWLSQPTVPRGSMHEHLFSLLLLYYFVMLAATGKWIKLEDLWGEIL